MPYIDPMLNAACNRQPPDPPDIVEHLRTAAANNRFQAERKIDTSGHALDHAQVVGKLAVAQMHDEAADEIERLRSVVGALHRELGME